MKVQRLNAKLLIGMLLLAATGLHAEALATAELKKPQAVRIVSPSPMREWAQLAVEGEVKALFRLDDRGRPYDIRIASATHPDLATAVENALRYWRFDHDGSDDIVYGMPFLFKAAKSN